MRPSKRHNIQRCMSCNDQFKIENILLYTEHTDCIPYYQLTTILYHHKTRKTTRYILPADFLPSRPKLLYHLVKSCYLKIGYRTDFRPVPLKVQLCFNGKLWNMVDGKQRLDTALPNHKELESFSGTGFSRIS